MPKIEARRVPWPRVWMCYYVERRSSVAVAFPTRRAALDHLGTQRIGFVEPYDRAPEVTPKRVTGFAPA